MRSEGIKSAKQDLSHRAWLTIFLFLCGCAATTYAPLEDLKTLPDIPADAAQIYFMRPASTVGGAAWPALLIDDKKRGILPSAAFTIVTVAPGERKVSLENEQGSIGGGWPHSVTVRVNAGERYFMKLEVASEITKGIAIVPSKIPLILPTQDKRVRSIRWVALTDAEGIKETGVLLYSPVEKSGY